MLKSFNKKLSHKLLSVLLVLLMLISIVPTTVFADVKPPTLFDAPPHFGVMYGGAYKFDTYISASDNMREFMKKRAEEDPDNKKSFTTYYQVDYKINNGNWHYTSAWDSPKTAPDRQYHNGELAANFKNGDIYAYAGSAYFEHIIAEADMPEINKIKELGWDYFKTNKFTKPIYRY